MQRKTGYSVWMMGGLMALAVGITTATDAQAQGMRDLTIQQLVNGPLFLHQYGPQTQMFHITGVPGNVSASKAALASSIQNVGFAGLPAAKTAYANTLQRLGIAPAVMQGYSFRLKQVGPHQSSGTATNPTLAFPVILQESRHSGHGPWLNKGNYTLRLTYVARPARKGFGPVPVLSALAMVRR